MRLRQEDPEFKTSRAHKETLSHSQNKTNKLNFLSVRHLLTDHVHESIEDL